MAMREIPQSEWPGALDQFSRGHQGQPAQITTMRAGEQRAQSQSSGMPLLGVTAEQLASNHPRLEIIAGDPSGAHLSHTVEHPAHLRLSEWNDGVSARLEIEEQDGTTVSVQVGPSQQVLPPGMVLDGLYERE